MTPKPEIPQPEPLKPEIPQPKTPQPDVPKPDIPKPGKPAPEIPEPKIPKPEIPKPAVPKPEGPPHKAPKPEIPHRRSAKFPNAMFPSVKPRHPRRRNLKFPNPLLQGPRFPSPASVSLRSPVLASRKFRCDESRIAPRAGFPSIEKSRAVEWRPVPVDCLSAAAVLPLELVLRIAAMLPSNEPRWKKYFASLQSDCQFAPPASESQLIDVEQALGCGLPMLLREFLLEADGAGVSRYNFPIIWSSAEIQKQNREFRTYAGFRELYMPFDHLLFFAADGGGDQFAYAIQPTGRFTRTRCSVGSTKRTPVLGTRAACGSSWKSN
jgi:hypothetical protein